MMNDNHSEIMRAIGRLEAGIQGVQNRLEKINGRIDAHDIKLDVQQSFLDVQKGRALIFGGISGGGIYAIIEIVKTLI